MKKLPSTENSYAPLHEMAMAPIRSRMLMAGIEMGIFDELTGFRPAGEIAEAIDAHKDNTERFLNALVTIGLVDKKNGLYRNRPAFSEFLVRRSPTYLGELLQMIEHMCLEPLDGLVGLVKDGPSSTTGQNDFASAELWARATRYSAAWVTGGAGSLMAGIVGELPEFKGFRRLLDLGGGHGMFALYFVDAHPSMTGVIFDRSAVVAVAEEFIREYGMQERLSVLAGDYLTDDIGENYDFIWACSTLNFARHDLDALFAKVKRALNPGGVFAALQDGMTHDQTRPAVMLGHLGDSMREDRDLSFEQGQIGDAMLRCGFRSVRSRTVRTPMGELDLDIARKDR
ncbi:O-methyltransferase [Desulfosarcina widdelii]|uniref:O-methyltransferase n=1 Tax=Desulfosarcina widdelii TaxID=947919 RepID=A0A5K7ZDI5_9BACT|nr:methyltransferase [Desulfosarcina widdelii]BBO76514.1 O-methyltransferase [Desulfosarcina widdelii]